MLARLMGFYRLQVRLLWHWRGGPRALLRRVTASFIVSCLAFGAAVWLIPGIHVHNLVSVGGAVIVLGLLNLLVRPIVLAVAARLSVVLVALLALLVQVYLLLALRSLVPGLEIDGFVAAFEGVWVYAIVNLVLSAVFSLGEDDSYYGALVRHLASRSGRAVPSQHPGLVLVQIDGLSHGLLQHQVRAGRVPVMSRWIRSGAMRLSRWETLLPSQTSASQAGILHGRNEAIPAFRWYEKASHRLIVSNRPADAAEIEHRVSDGHGLLSVDGASIGNMLTGDASRSYLTMASLARGAGGIGDSQAFSGFFISPYGYFHALVLTLAEVIKEIVQARREARAGIEPRLPRGLPYPFVRALTNVALRSLSTSLVVEEMYRGRSVIYVDFTDHDEIAHYSGPERGEALDALDGVDRVIGSLARAAEDAPRPYRFVILSDHGQSLGATFRQRYGQTLEAVVRSLMGGEASVQAATSRVEQWGPLNTFVSEFTRASGAGPRLARAALRRRTREGLVELGPEGRTSGRRRRRLLAPPPQPPEARPAPAAPRPPPDLVVCASGNLALIYFNVAPGRLTSEQLEQHYPGLVGALANHPGIGVLLLRSAAHGAVAVGEAGVRYLDEDRVVGQDPLDVFGPYAVASLKRLDAMPNVGDLVAISVFEPETGEVAAFEELIGSHGGLGGPQTEGFLLAPAEWPLADEPLVGAPALYLVLRGWLEGQLGIRFAERPAAGEEPALAETAARVS